MKKARDPQELEKVKTKILDNSLSIIIDEGFSALTMRRIASKTHMTAPNLYNYFANKDEIYITLVIRGFEILVDQMKQAAGLSSEPVSQAKGLMTAYLKFGIEQGRYYEIMFTRSTPKYNDYKGTPMERLAAIEYNLSMELVALVTGVVEKIIGNTSDNPALNPVKILIETWSLLHGMISLHSSNIIGYVYPDPEEIFGQILDDSFQRFLANLNS